MFDLIPYYNYKYEYNLFNHKYNNIEVNKICKMMFQANETKLNELFKPEYKIQHILTINYNNIKAFIKIICESFFPATIAKCKILNGIMKKSNVAYNSILYDIITYLKNTIENTKEDKIKNRLERNRNFFAKQYLLKRR